MANKTFHEQLKQLMDNHVHLIYKISRGFPRDEMYGLTSQTRRAAMSVILNYIEDYARMHDKVHKNFLEISYGSLKESRYLLDFAYAEDMIPQQDYKAATELAEKIGAMLWGIIRKL